jgi:SAM-dependent methyltransferase
MATLLPGADLSLLPQIDGPQSEATPKSRGLRLMSRMATAHQHDYWGVAPPETVETFYGSPLLRAYLLEAVSGNAVDGDPGPHWAERFVIDRYLQDSLPFGRCLSLGCGFGEVERLLAGLGAFESCVGIDISAAALGGARAAAQAEGLVTISYLEADLNRAVHEEQGFDLVWANGALHHLHDVEFAVGQAYSALRVGGWFVAVEYVGPPHQNFPPRQRELINALLHLQPERLRYAREDRFVPPALRHRGRGIAGAYLRLRRLTTPGRFQFGKIWDRDRRHFKRIDPTEGVHADRIVPAIMSTFDDVEVHPFNGALLPYVLERRFFQRFDARRDSALLDLLIEAERTLTDIGEVAPDHAIIVGRRMRPN